MTDCAPPEDTDDLTLHVLSREVGDGATRQEFMALWTGTMWEAKDIQPLSVRKATMSGWEYVRNADNEIIAIDDLTDNGRRVMFDNHVNAFIGSLVVDDEVVFNLSIALDTQLNGHTTSAVVLGLAAVLRNVLEGLEPPDRHVVLAAFSTLVLMQDRPDADDARPEGEVH